MIRQKMKKESRVYTTAKRPKGAVLSHIAERVAYTGSPDSEVVAGYVGHFSYDPGRTEEMRKKYASILKEK